MLLRQPLLSTGRTEDETADSGAETAGSDCGKMSCSSTEPVSSPGQEERLLVTLHLLTNPGDSLLLQLTLDRLLRWVRPGLRLFRVSERACPLQDDAGTDPCPVGGFPSLAVTMFLHESFGEERILRVLDFLQRPPWQIHPTDVTSPSSAPLRPYLLPSRDFSSLGAGMPVWGVRTVHYGEEVVRVTLHSTYDNFEDGVRLYETVLRRRAEEQKPGFVWFTLLSERGFSLQLAIKQLSPGARVEPCCSAVLQFRVGEIGQLVPLLPNTCSPISATRWHTEDLDGNKILFQVSAPAQPQALLTSAFPLSCPRTQLRASPGRRPSRVKEQPVGRPPRGLRSGACGRESVGSDGTPPGSSCYSSQRSSPAGQSVNWCEPAVTSDLLLEEEEPETNVDTGVSALVTLSRDLKHALSEPRWTSEAETRASPRPSRHQHTPAEEFFI
ncbi:hypothetical protein R3I94_006870 [Phoxinus phoxinus]